MIGDRLKKVRGKMSQEEAANKIGISRARLSHYETGRSEPDSEILGRLAKFYNVTTDYLITGKTRSDNEGSTMKEKDEKDIAKRMEEIKKDLSNQDGLMFSGEPLSDEAIESLMEAMEHMVRNTQRINKKYIPKKYRDKETE